MSVTSLIGIAAIGAGCLSLRRGWSGSHKSTLRRLWVIAGWLLIAAGLYVYVMLYGAERGGALMLCVLGIAAFGVVAFSYSRKPLRKSAARAPLAPSLRGSRVWAGVIRFLLAGPVSFIAATGIGLAIAIQAPMNEADRLILGGSLVPFLWGGGMAWTLADDKVIRAMIVLLGAGAAGFAIAMV